LKYKIGKFLAILIYLPFIYAELAYGAFKIIKKRQGAKDMKKSLGNSSSGDQK